MSSQFTEIKHPAKFSDGFIPIFAEKLSGCSNVLDPFAGTGKIGYIKKFGFAGVVYANELEKEWLEPNVPACDVLTFCDAEFLSYDDCFFDAICTSPTYGNRMADHHNAKDGSKRITYTHCLGRSLSSGNTGVMQFGNEYKIKHKKIYENLYRMLKYDGIFILNISDHIRNGERVFVSDWHIKTLEDVGLKVEDKIELQTTKMKFGSNSTKRVPVEYIFVLRKTNIQA